MYFMCFNAWYFTLCVTSHNQYGEVSIVVMLCAASDEHIVNGRSGVHTQSKALGMCKLGRAMTSNRLLGLCTLGISSICSLVRFQEV